MRFVCRKFSPGLLALVADTLLNAIIVTTLFKRCTVICSLIDLSVQTEGPGHINIVKKSTLLPRGH